MFEPDPKVSDHVKKDQKVIIRRYGNKLSGIVTKVTDNKQWNKNGIEVELHTGFRGNVIQFEKIWPTNDVLLDLIKSHESSDFELKDSFAIHDIIESHAREVTAFLNSNGGYLCFGVDDEGLVIGLENDYSEIRKSLRKRNRGDGEISIQKLRDEFILQMIPKLTKYIIPKNCPLDVKIYTLDEKDVCLVKIFAGKHPHYAQNSKSGTQEFLIRSANGKKPLSIIDAIDYILEKYHTIS